ncbi:hypothetical protein JTE90_025797 [Oedothorax gibbosus]|uniref:H15 domain-containing protein n=1 Tax=Oedothorax gibbosus TaxID=931172 RepID=A0AAV6V0Q1_9ARAC|nr:hypothetical protein JTE90_025797 [Oedothorax gibbosus]
MKPKQNAPKKYLDINSASAKRLLKWINTTVSSTGGVTYTQVKQFVDSTERHSYDIKDVLNNFLEQGRLRKVGYKFALPQSLKKKQVSKKSTVKRCPENPLKQNQNVKKYPVIPVKRCPGILDIRDTGIRKFLNKFCDHGHLHTVRNKYAPPQSLNKTQIKKKSTAKKNAVNIFKQNKTVPTFPVVEVNRSPLMFDDHDSVMAEICSLEENTSNVAIYSQSIDTEIHSANVYAETPKSSQTPIDSEEPSQNTVTAIPSQNTDASEFNDGSSGESAHQWGGNRWA